MICLFFPNLASDRKQLLILALPRMNSVRRLIYTSEFSTSLVFYQQIYSWDVIQTETNSATLQPLESI